MGEVTYQESERLKISAKGEYFIYKPLTISHAWQSPVFFTVSAFMDLFDKIVLKSDLFVGRRTVTAFNEPTVNNIVLNESDEIEFINSTGDDLFVFNLKPFLDMNISAEYR